jgi:hypothetical protein
MLRIIIQQLPCNCNVVLQGKGMLPEVLLLEA